MKYGKFFKKFFKWLVIMIVLILLSKAANKFHTSFLDKQFERNKEGIILGAEPILIEKSNETAVLLLHGLNSNPSMWQEYAAFLANKDITVYAPLIAGHGTSVFDLEKTTYKDWIKSTEEAYLSLQNKYENVYVVGMSLGGLLTLDLAAKYNLNGIIVLNTPIYFNSKLIEFVYIVTLVQDYYVKGIFPDDEYYIQEQFKNYKAISYITILEILNLIEDVNLNINKIEEPTLVVQSFNDDIVDPKSGLFILTNVNSKKKDIISLRTSTHINITSSDQLLLSEETYKFILENE